MGKKKAAEHEEDGDAEIAEAEDICGRSEFVGDSAHIQPQREVVGEHQQTGRRAQKVRSGQSLLLSHLVPRPARSMMPKSVSGFRRTSCSTSLI
jgi:hypothetical protein